MRELTPDSLIKEFDIVTSPTGEAMVKALAETEPNQFNLVVTSRSETTGDQDERLYSAEGLPLTGVIANGYTDKPIPKRLQLGLTSYERQDSTTRQNSAEAPRNYLNKGADVHLRESFNLLPSLIRGVAAVHREASPGTPGRDLTAMETFNAVTGMLSLWSFERYRTENKPGRFFGKPADLDEDIALLHRVMSGVHMSLARLYISDKYHVFGRVTDKKAAKGFSTEHWLAQNEKHDQLRTQTDDGNAVVCPAPTQMIRSVMNMTIKEPEEVAQDSQWLLERLKVDDPQRLIDFARAYGTLGKLYAQRIKLEEATIKDVFRSASINTSMLSAKKSRAQAAFAGLDEEAEKALVLAKSALGKV